MRESGRPTDDSDRIGSRGQLSLSAVEAVVGALFVLAVTTTFVLGVPAPPVEEAQLDTYAADALSVLSREAPRHAGPTRLAEVSADRPTFDRERAALERRVDRILPENLMYRLETPVGAVGYPYPPGVTAGRAGVTTVNGRVTLRVWYV